MKTPAVLKNRWTKKTAVAICAALLASLFVGRNTSAAPRPDSIRHGGSVKVAIFDNFPGFCVGDNPANSALMATRSIYETLFEKTVGGNTVGLLARGATSSSDLKTWTVTLREGIYFHDGTEFNAGAVFANFNAITGRVAAQALALQGLDGYRAKAYTVGTGTAFTANIKSMRVVSDYVIEFTLDRPQNDFRSTLYASGRFVMRAPSQLLDADSCAKRPVGTGPFKYSSSTPSQLIVTRNRDYWRHDPKTNARLPYLDRITFDVVINGLQRSAAVRTGTYDAAFFSAATDASFIKDLRARRTKVTEYRSARAYYPSLWLNQNKPRSPFVHKSARQAVLSCLDRERYNKVRLKGEGAVAKSIVGPSSVMYNQSGFPRYSRSKARDYVEQYKRETGESALSFVFPVDTSLSSQANGRFLKAMWKDCNIIANYVVEQTPLILSKLFNPNPNIAEGEFYSAYDAVLLTLFEGNDVAFNVPFIASNAFPEDSTNPVHPLFQSTLGHVLSLNHHHDVAVDEYFYRGQATADRDAARSHYRNGTAYLQRNAFMGAIASHYYSMFTTKKIAGVGKLKFPNGKTQRVVTNWGIDWTGVYKTL
jgi:ABC-type transport system substrate-binding protein